VQSRIAYGSPALRSAGRAAWSQLPAFDPAPRSASHLASRGRGAWSQVPAFDPTPQFLADSYGEVSLDGVEHFVVVIEKLAGTASRPVWRAFALNGAARGQILRVPRPDRGLRL